MKQYTYRLHLGYKPMGGTNITVKATSEEAGRKEVLRILKTATLDMMPERLEFLLIGRMSPARMARIDNMAGGAIK